MVIPYKPPNIDLYCALQNRLVVQRAFFLQLNHDAQCLLLAVGKFDSCQEDFNCAQVALSGDWSAFLGYIAAPPSLWDARAPFNLTNSDLNASIVPFLTLVALCRV